MANLPQDITTARQYSQGLAQRAGELSSYEGNVTDILKKKALEAYNYNQDIIQPLDVATQGYLNAPTEARAKYQDIFNPFTRENLVSQYASQQAIPALTLSSLLGQRQGTIADIINAGTGAYKAQTGAATSAAQLARQNYEDILNEYLKTTELGIQGMRASAAPKPPAVLYKGISDYNSIAGLLNNMKTAITHLKDKSGRVKGLATWANAMIGGDTLTKNYLDWMGTYSSTFAKGIGRETGVLTDPDITRALSAMPKPTDTSAELEKKKKDIDQVLNNLQFNLKSQFSLAGVPFSPNYLLQTSPIDEMSQYEELLKQAGF